MRIAILGATSQIAKDLVQSFCGAGSSSNTGSSDGLHGHALSLFARNPTAVAQWLGQVGLPDRCSVGSFDQFAQDTGFDAILNFVGVGDPAQALAMGAAIFDVTYQFDALALHYVQRNPHCRYIFLSSGAAYGSTFETPAHQHTQAAFELNHLQPQDWYAVAKLHAECRHRALAELPIVDIRVFNYVSPTQSSTARFLTSDILRAIQTHTVLSTSLSNMVRDYMGPSGFFELVSCLLRAPATNTAVDCYTQSPIDKMSLLAAMAQRYGLQYCLTDAPSGLNATGHKNQYFSTYHNAQQFGYSPHTTALQNVVHAFDISLGMLHHAHA